MIDQKITLKYAFATVGAVLFTWLLHEFTHWFTSELLGYEAIMRLNSVSPVAGQQQNKWHQIYISASGPIITLLQALFIFIVLKTKGWNKFIYPLLFVPLYMRILAGVMNVIKPNDEGRISEFLGTGLYTLSILVSLFLFLLVYKTAMKYNLSWKFNTSTTILIMIVSSLLILSDQFFKIRIL
ncbi:hypothetical protein [Aureibaculum conchae]|uniref:hypothetical protein n=1 Tax=Aureibaculum sp. 2308TA14-22 TaxID=3108392 RepID=UPI003390C485